MKKYKIIGKYFTKQYGFLASHSEDIFEAVSKKEALEEAKKAFLNCNKFIIEELKTN